MMNIKSSYTIWANSPNEFFNDVIRILAQKSLNIPVYALLCGTKHFSSQLTVKQLWLSLWGINIFVLSLSTFNYIKST